MRACLYLGILLSIPMAAQEESAPVIIDGRELLRVHGPVGQFKATDRAPEIKHRIITLAEKGYTGKIEIREIASEKAAVLYAGPATIMAVTDLDAQAEGASRRDLAERYAAIIQDAIKGYDAVHTWRRFFLSFAKTVLVWAVFCLTVWGCAKAISLLRRRVEEWLSRRQTARGSPGFHLLFWERMWLVLLTAVKFSVGVSLVGVSWLLLSYTLGLYPQTYGISNTLLDSLRATFGSAAIAVVEYLPNGGFVIVVCILTHYLLRLLKFAASAIENGDLVFPGMHPEMAKPTYQLVRVAVLLFALVVVFPYLPGGKSEAFKGVTIFVGVLISFGSSSAVGNILAGIVLTYMRPFHVGDRVKIADTTGDIMERTLLVTRVRTIKNVEVVIPNSAILGSQILNYSAMARTSGLILHTTVTIGYDAPWRKVHELLINAALATDGVLKEPRPFVLETSLNDFHISYELNAFTDRPNDMIDIYSHLHEAIQDSFNRGGVEIMSPSFYALRDGNTVTIPAEHRPPGYQSPSFRVKS